MYNILTLEIQPSYGGIFLTPAEGCNKSSLWVQRWFFWMDERTDNEFKGVRFIEKNYIFQLKFCQIWSNMWENLPPKANDKKSSSPPSPLPPKATDGGTPRPPLVTLSLLLSFFLPCSFPKPFFVCFKLL